MVKWPVRGQAGLLNVTALPPKQEGNCRQPAFRLGKEPAVKPTDSCVCEILCNTQPNRGPNVLIVTNACLYLRQEIEY